MAKQEQLDIAYMRCAEAISCLSHAVRKKVGCIVVSANGGIIAEGVNGTPSKFDNRCETEGLDTIGRAVLITKPEVIHNDIIDIA